LGSLTYKNKPACATITSNEPAENNPWCQNMNESPVPRKPMSQFKTSRMSALLVTLRPCHWIKNFFVFAPLVFSGRFTQISYCIRAALAFITFCLFSSAVYIINDLYDRNQDRLHPVKKIRPIASGVVSPLIAVSTSTALIISGFILAMFLGAPVAAVMLIYLLINVIYSSAIKHIAILDVLFISSGFVLRIIGGGVSVAVVPSYWLILCTLMISLFLGFTKRRAELLVMDQNLNNSRLVLKDYSIAFLDQVIPIITGSTIICYALYTVDEHTLQVLGSRWMLVTLPFVVYGLIRYIYIIYHQQKGSDPTDALIRDIPTIINLMLWFATSLLVIRYGRELNISL
jgi:4-hydroxybenzoate polyprenyltransferase